MALTRLCSWHYGLEKFDVYNHERLACLQPGDVLSRKAMPGTNEFFRSAMGMLHFGCVVSVPTCLRQQRPLKKSKNQSQLQDQTNSAEKSMMSIQVVHFVKDKQRHICQVKETNMLYFVFGHLIPEKITNRDEAKNVFVLWNSPDQEIRRQTVLRAQKSLGSENYNLFYMNCEHWVQKILYAKEWSSAHSIQIQATLLLILLLVFLICVFLLRNSQQTTTTSKKQQTCV